MKVFSSYILGLFFRFSYLRKFLWFAITCIPALVLVSLVFVASDTETKPIGWENSLFVSPAGIRAKNVDVTSNGSYIVAVYDGEANGVKGVYASVSFDSGSSYLKPVNIVNLTTVIDSVPKVAISATGEVFVAWQSQIADGSSSKIHYSLSRDFGANWSSPEEFVTNYDNEILPRVFYDERGVLHVFYHAADGNMFNLFHAIRPPGETKFTQLASIMKLSSSMKGAFFPAIKFFGSNVILVWQGRNEMLRDHLYALESSDYGTKWSGTKQITSGAVSNASPAIEVRGDNLYLCYQSNEGSSWTIKLLIRRKGSWDSQPISMTGIKSNCYSPKIAFTQDDELLVTWYDIRESRTQIYARRFDIFENKPLDVEQKISLNNAAAMSPVVTASGNRVIVFWETMTAIESKYTDIYVAPPRVFSATHQDGAWSRNSSAIIEWTPPQDESGIIGYATTIVTPSTEQPAVVDLNPDVQTNSADVRRAIIPNLEDGVTYFCIRAIDGAGNFSRTIRYKLQVSSNPLPMPSFTETPKSDEGGAPGSPNAKFKWSLGEAKNFRLKGFLYSISKEKPTVPTNFTSNFGVDFQSLPEGNYFFSVVAVDVTEQKSVSADYVFTVGNVPKIAEKDIVDMIDQRVVPGNGVWNTAGIARPKVTISFPFDTDEVYRGRSLEAAIAVSGINAKNIDGYSVVSGRSELTAPPEVNQESGKISIAQLTNGEWFVSVRARYYTMNGGEKLHYWTNPAMGSFNVQTAELIAPRDFYGLFLKMEGKSFAVAFFMALLSLVVGTIGFGRRLVFYTKLLQFKTKNLLVR